MPGQIAFDDGQRVLTLRASDDSSRPGGNIYPGDSLIMASKFIFQFKALARSIVYFDIVSLSQQQACDGLQRMSGRRLGGGKGDGPQGVP